MPKSFDHCDVITHKCDTSALFTFLFERLKVFYCFLDVYKTFSTLVWILVLVLETL